MPASLVYLTFAASGNLFGIILILGEFPFWFLKTQLPILTAEGALRAPSTANPPYNMHAALILHGCVVMVCGAFVFALRARQVRREKDEIMMKNNNNSLEIAGVAKGDVEHHLDVVEAIVEYK